MDFKDLKNKSIKELQDLLSEKREEVRELRFKASENQLKKVREIRNNKKIVAQILTLLNAKNKK
ncbi:MAG TPA: 50S ribosomal protein L29 [Candidatus Magasanikbacteria bacterium]|nr:50S ribosomal protein L29 [Candidatus Magasanikbacteria bacterium]